MSDIYFIDQIDHLSRQSIELCYHCHKCTAGCPVAAEMEYGPDRVLRMVQMGEKERLFASQDIWLCASCETCGTRCPNQIDIAQVMDALRSMAVVEGATAGGSEAVKFHKLFLFFIKNMGRMHEASLLAVYKLWTHNLVADMDSGARMFAKGKIPLAPNLLKSRSKVKQIFERTK
jgi:heterodisulfide reductase subunit C